MPSRNSALSLVPSPPSETTAVRIDRWPVLNVISNDRVKEFLEPFRVEPDAYFDDPKDYYRVDLFDKEGGSYRYIMNFHSGDMLALRLISPGVYPRNYIHEAER